MKKNKVAAIFVIFVIIFVVIFSLTLETTCIRTEIKGIDVSEYQKNINWKNVKADGVVFAIIRASYGDGTSRFQNNGVDPMFETNYTLAKANGIKVGAYHYCYAATVQQAKTEADFFISRLKGKTFEYPVCLDLEDPSLDKLDKETLTDIAIVFLKELKDAGYYPMIYCSKTWFTTKLDDARLYLYPHWLEQYSPSITYTGSVGIWQYTSNGTVNGIIGKTDMDISFVDYETKIKLMNLNGF